MFIDKYDVEKLSRITAYLKERLKRIPKEGGDLTNKYAYQSGAYEGLIEGCIQEMEEVLDNIK